MADCAVCGKPVPDVAYVGAECERDLAGRLSDTADLWPELLTTAAGQARMADPGPRARGLAPPEPIRPDIGGADQQPGPPTGLPFRWHAAEVADAVLDTATEWAATIVGERGAEWPVKARRGTERLGRVRQLDAPVLLRWLAGQLGWCRYQRWAAECWDELGYACSRITPAVDRPLPRLDAGVCMAELEDGTHCPQRLSAPPGARLIHCPGCGGHWDPTDRSTAILAAAAGILLSADECAALLSLHGRPTPASTVRSWVSRRQLLAHAPGRYRFGDAHQLRVAMRERIRT
jgi:hypothetical protein